MVALTGFGVGMLAYGARTGTVILSGRFCHGVIFSRETRPVGYWSCMVFYVCWTAFCSYVLYHGLLWLGHAEI
jgi:hypothetical protein